MIIFQISHKPYTICVPKTVDTNRLLQILESAQDYAVCHGFSNHSTDNIFRSFRTTEPNSVVRKSKFCYTSACATLLKKLLRMNRFHKSTSTVRGLVKEEYLRIILGFFFQFLHKTYVVGVH